MNPLRAALGSAVIMLAALALSAVPALAAEKYQKIEPRNMIIIGDRAVDIAFHLGVLPTGMNVRCSLWPMCDKLKVVSQPLRCPGCLTSGQTETLTKFIKAKGIKLAIVEKSQPFCILKADSDPVKALPLLEKLGVEAKIVDFSQGVAPAIAQTAAILGKQEAGQALAAKYEKAVKKLDKAIAGKKLGKKVVVLQGIYQAQTGKAFIQVEAPGGYADKFILEPLGCANVGQALVPAGKEPAKGHWTIRKLAGLAKAKPDAIVITGDSVAVQKALAEAIVAQPELGKVPVFSLPRYIDSSVIERPEIVGKWLWALK
ncbi:hypothetical protein AAU61_17160 [Desulfocarbo indianensis]|nr:hypothetical protein AAU61_17160 [Desulfocarbo indianensis]